MNELAILIVSHNTVGDLERVIRQMLVWPRRRSALAPRTAHGQCVWLSMHVGLIDVDACQVEHDDNGVVGLVHVDGRRPDGCRMRMLGEHDARPLARSSEMRQVALHLVLPVVNRHTTV